MKVIEHLHGWGGWFITAIFSCNQPTPCVPHRVRAAIKRCAASVIIFFWFLIKLLFSRCDRRAGILGLTFSVDSCPDSDARRKKKVQKKKGKHHRHPPLEERPIERHQNPPRDGGSEDQLRGSRHRGRDREEAPPLHQRERSEVSRRTDPGHEGKRQERGAVRDASRADRRADTRRSREKEPESRSGRQRSKSRDRSQKETDSRDSYRNGLERSGKENRHSDRQRESRRNDDHSRDSPPRRRR